MSIVSDVVERSRLEQTADGFRAERRFVVTDVGGSAASRHYNALLAAGVPRIGEPHPVIPGLPCAQIIVEPLGPSQFELSAIYQLSSAGSEAAGANGWLVEWFINTQTETTAEDIHGNPFSSVTTKYGITGSLAVTYTAEIQVPRQGVRARRQDDAWTARQIIAYTGRVNAGTWNGYPPRTWLCVGLNYTPGSDLSVEFSYEPDTWDFIQPSGLLNTGGESYQVYEAKDFSPLGISF